ncbi:hypothetical protein IQ37_03215 [Chryseobacterium piperi]|uniref:Cleaved adhesin domain-containing protein n=2 Tax=Chryseobacterium piperi TaxID=558152 RepID=A0A086BML6_9FLAO|nr:hypothetical protein CJF12_07545 [Chryseobacterium piperi]KFF30180.1 hypothetical protein IQ37_03215 [Chryseobacterium piperi]
MKKKFLTIGMLSISATAISQVGINTPNPQATFHIDGAKDNEITGIPTAKQQSNDFVVTSEGNTGIGTTKPDPSADLTLASTNRGFLPNKVNLNSINDAVTILNPATGLLIYNTGAGELKKTGYYYNSSTPSAPVWSYFEPQTTTSGNDVKKIIFTKTSSCNASIIDGSVDIDHFKFYFRSRNGDNEEGCKPYMALTTSPGNDKIFYLGINQQYATGGFEYDNRALTYTNTNFATAQFLDRNIQDALANSELNIIHIVDTEANKYYRVTFYISGGGNTYAYMIIAEGF